VAPSLYKHTEWLQKAVHHVMACFPPQHVQAPFRTHVWAAHRLKRLFLFWNVYEVNPHVQTPQASHLTHYLGACVRACPLAAPFLRILFVQR
jgi:hypothetical protein